MLQLVVRVDGFTSLKEMVTFSWNLDLSVVTPLSGGGNCAAARPRPLRSKVVTSIATMTQCADDEGVVVEFQLLERMIEY